MNTLTQVNYVDFFCSIFNLVNLQDAVGKEVLLTEELKQMNYNDCYEDAERIDTIEKILKVDSVNVINEHLLSQHIVITLDDKTSIDFCFPFRPGDIQMRYSGGEHYKVLKKGILPFSKKIILCLRFFRMNGGRIAPTVSES